jgi:hypothetical protein
VLPDRFLSELNCTICCWARCCTSRPTRDSGMTVTSLIHRADRTFTTPSSWACGKSASATGGCIDGRSLAFTGRPQRRQPSKNWDRTSDPNHAERSMTERDTASGRSRELLENGHQTGRGKIGRYEDERLSRSVTRVTSLKLDFWHWPAICRLRRRWREAGLGAPLRRPSTRRASTRVGGLRGRADC